MSATTPSESSSVAAEAAGAAAPEAEVTAPSFEPAVHLGNVDQLFAEFDSEVPSVDELRKVYCDDLVFRDPIQEIRGLEAFREMNVRLLKRADSMTITMRDAAQNGNVILMTFEMRMRPNKRAPEMVIEGATKLVLDADGRIAEHRDYWDLLGSAMDAIPGVARGYRRLVRALG